LSESFYDTLTSEIDKIRPRSKDMVVIGGDWNARPVSENDGDIGVLGKEQYGPSNYNSRFWLDWCAEWNFCVPISFMRKAWKQRSTWYHSSSRKWYCQDAFVVQQCQRHLVHDTRSINGLTPISDHKPVMMKMVVPAAKYYRRQITTKVHQIQLSNPVAVEVYQKAIEEGIREQQQTPQVSCPNDRMQNLLKLIKRSAERAHIPSRRRFDSWVSDEYKNAYAVYCSAATVDKRRKRRICSRLLRRDRRSWLNGLCNAASIAFEENKMGDMYNILNEIQGLNAKKPQLPIQKSDGELIYDSNEIANELAEHVVRNSLSFPESTVQELPPSPNLAVDILTMPPTIDEIKGLIASLPCKKAAGPDNVMYEHCKAGGELVAQEICNLFISTWREGKVPDSWRTVTLRMLPKKTGILKANDHRPLAMTSVLCKLWEKLLMKRIYEWYETTLMPEQAGFLRNRGTAEQILSLKLLAQQAKAAKSPLYICFVDLRGAYDSIPRALLMKVLRHLGLPNTMLDMIESLYDETTFQVKVNDKLSNPKPLNRGLLQGGSASPCLFNCFLNVIMSAVNAKLGDDCGAERFVHRQDDVPTWPPKGSFEKQFFRWLLFADDIAGISDSKEGLNRMITVLSEELKKFGVEMSSTKTMWTVVADPDICAAGVDRGTIAGGVSHTDKYKYLGINLETLTDDDRAVNDRISLANSRLFLLRKLLSDVALSRRLRFQLITVYVFSTALYGSETLVLTKRVMKRMQVLENRCMRRVLGIKLIDKISSKTMRETLGVSSSLCQRIKARRLKFVGHLCRRPWLPASRLLFARCNSRLVGRKRCYVKDIATDLQSAGNPSFQNRQQYSSKIRDWASKINTDGSHLMCGCGKPYISATWLSKHQARCDQQPRQQRQPGRPRRQ
jgi:hypothetical protein